MTDELTIRTARPDDRAAMEWICAHTWDWGDYIPEVWDDWLADERGHVAMGELEGRVVALGKVTFHSPEQAWFEGMRVHPDYRRLGVARQFLEYKIARARARGVRVVRLGTSWHNTAAHHLAAWAGMERVGSYALRIAEPLPGGSLPALLTPEDADQVRAFLRASPVLAHARGLYSVDWAWQTLSEPRMVEFLQNRQAVAARAPGGALAALAVCQFDPSDGRLWVGFADGEPDTIPPLARDIRSHAAQIGAEMVGIMLSDLAWLRQAFEVAGYHPGDWEGELWIFERWLGADEGCGDDG